MVPPRSPAPSTNFFCSSIVEITGSTVSGSNSVEPALLEAGDVAGVLDDHALQAQAQAEGRDAVGARVVQRAELALDAADAEAAGHQHGVDVGEVLGGAGLGLALVGGDPADVDLGLVGEAAGAQRLADREVGVGQVDVLADQRDGDLLRRVVHAAEQVVPRRPVDVAERQVETAYDVGVEALAVQHLRDVVDRRRVGRGDHGLVVDVAHQRDLALDAVGQVAVGAAHDRVGLDADGAQRGHRVLGRLGLQLARRADVGHQRDVDEEAVVAADLVPRLARGLEERQRLDVADGAADLGDHHVDVRAAHREDAVLDLVGDVRDDLHGVAEVVAATLLGDDRRVDLPGRHVGDLVEVGVEEPLVVPDVEVGLGAVVGDEHLAVLERVHRARIHVEVGVELLHRDAQSARLQQVAQAGGGEPLAEGGGDASGHENVLGRRGVLHGLRSYPRGTGPSAPDAPKAPPGVVSERCRASIGGQLGRPRCRCRRRSRPRPQPGRRAAGRAGPRRRRRASRRRRRRWPGRPGPAARPARIASDPSSPASVPSTSSTSGARRATLVRLLHQAGAADGVGDRPRLAASASSPSAVLARDREAEQLADPVVRRRVGRDDALALLGQQLAAERVDQRLLRGVDEVGAERRSGR